MPLPKEYYDILKSGDKPFNAPTQGSSLYPSIMPERQEDPSSAWGSIGDFLWSASTGFTSGMTWGVTDLMGVTGREPWEEMTGTEKAGWILGEGAALFAPWGPFGLMAKGSKAVAKGLGNKFVREAAESAVGKGTVALTKEQGAAVAKAAGKGVNFSDDIIQGLNKVAQDDIGITWIKNLSATGKTARDASNMLTNSSTRAVMKAFDEAGVDIAGDQAERIAGDFVESLGKGTYVNDVAEWVARKFGGQVPGKTREVLSKYLGMAAQDAYMMGTHGLISGKIKALANGEEFNVGESLSHAGLMSLGFPLIRAIPNIGGLGKGGMVSASQGIKSYMNIFKKTNYQAIRDAHGDEVTKNMARIMLKGSKKDLLNTTDLYNSSFTIGKHRFINGSEILEKLDDMKGADVVTLLNKMNKSVNKSMLKKWGPEFIKDAIGSSGRMAAGITIMNPWILEKNAWKGMEGPELASHLFISALMTKGRGAWGHKEQRAYLADFTKEHEALNILGANVKNIQDRILFHDGANVWEGMGAAISTHEVGQEIVKIFDTALKDAPANPSGRDYSNPDHALVMELNGIYSLIKSNSDPNYTPEKIQNLDAKTLATLATHLKAIKFADGKTIGDVKYEGTLSRLTTEPAARVLDIYKRALSKLNSELGIPIDIGEDGRMLAYHIVSNIDGKTIDDANTVNRIVSALHNLDPANHVIRRKPNGDSETTNYESIVKDSGLTPDQFNIRVREIIREHMDIIGEQYGDRNILRDPVDDNPMMDFLHQAKYIEANERVYNIMTGAFPRGDKSGDAIFAGDLDTIFKLSDLKYAHSIDAYKDILRKDLIEDPKTPEEKAANAEIMLNIENLRTIFELRKQTLGGSSRKSVKEKGEMSAAALKQVADSWQDIMKGLPVEWKSQNWSGHIRTIFMERLYKAKGIDRRARDLIVYMHNEGMALPAEGNKIGIFSRKALMDEAKDRQWEQKDIDELGEALTTIEKVLPKEIIEEIPYAPTESGRRKFQEVDMGSYLKAAKMLGNRMYSDLLVETQNILSNIVTKNEGNRKHLREIHDKITNLLTTLDPATTGKPVKDPVSELRNLRGQLEGMLKVNELNETGILSDAAKERISNIKEVSGQLELLIDKIDIDTGKFKILPKDNLTPEEEMVGDPYGIHSALTRPLQETLVKIVNAEADGLDRMQQLVVRINNLAASGKAGMGLNKADTMAIIENLSRDWYKLYTGEKEKGVKVLSELIKDVNENGFFGDAVSLLESINMEVNRRIILNNEHHILNEEALQVAELLEKGHKTHEHHRSVVEIMKEYDLADKDGKLSQGFKNAVATDPRGALQTHVRDKIFAKTDKTFKEKQREWLNFRLNDATELLNNVHNSAPINKVSIVGYSKEGGNIVWKNGVPNIMHPNNKYFSDKGFKVHWIEDTMSVDIGSGRLRNVSLDTISSPADIQLYLNKAIRSDEIGKDILDGFRSVDHGISEADIAKMLKNPSEYIFYLRLSPMDKMMFIASDKNLKLLDTEYADWYDRTLAEFSGVEAETFKNMFGSLKDKPNTSRSIVELKMMLPYLDHTGKRSEIEAMIKEFSTAEGFAQQKIAAIQANMLKRGFLSDGGTTQPLNIETLRWVSSTHPDKAIRNEARRIVKQGGFHAVVAGDNSAAGKDGDRSHPLNIESLALGQLNVRGRGASKLVEEIAQAQIRGLSGMESLMNSVLDGAKFASENTMKLLMAQKHWEGTDFSTSPNGAKTIIFATGDNQLLGKGYMIYHPEIAKHMPKGVDILLGDSSAKTQHGKNLDGNPVELFELATAKGDWKKSLKKIGKKNTMLLPVESIGVSFTSKNEDGVTISSSIFDFQNPKAIQDGIDWMNFTNTLDKINMEWGFGFSDGGSLANHLYDINAQMGAPMDKGDTGLSKMLFTYGAMPDMPWVQKALKRMIRASNFRHLSKVPNKYGEDNFIVPNVEGDLSVPLYAELYGAKRPIKGYVKDKKGKPKYDKAGKMIPIYEKEVGDRTDRVSMQFGGIGLNKHTASRQMGDGSQRSNLSGEKFIYRDANGVDIVIGFDKNGKFQYDSPFYNKTEAKDIQYKGTQNGQDVFRDADMSLDTKSHALAQQQLKALQKIVFDYNLDFFDVFRVLNGQTITKTDINGVDQSVSLPTNKGLKMQLGVLSHAIPVIGHDKVVFRVEKILNNMQGLTELNVHDLRTVMQRDNDGDHLYTHTRLPWNVFKRFSNENGRKDDFRMFERKNVMDRKYINIFGLDENGVAGMEPSQVGFQNYANKLHNARMMTGQVIGARNVLSWMARMNLHMSGDPLLKEFLIDKGMTSDSWKALDKFYDTVQNALDIHGGIHAALKTQDMLKDFLYYGLTDQYAELTGDPVFDGHNQPGLGFFNPKHNFGSKGIHKEIFNEILRTLKKANMIQNDTWDEKGSRAPEPNEIKDAYYDMKNFFENPSLYLSKKLVRRIGNVRNESKRKALAREYAELFYGKDLDMKDSKKRQKLYIDILKGKTDAMPKEVFNFTNVRSADKAFDMSIGGHVMKKLVGTNGFWQESYGSISGGDKEMYNAAGFFVKNIESFVETVRLFEGEGTAEYREAIESAGDISIGSFRGADAPAIPSYIRNALNNGVLREFIHQQYKDVFGTLEHFRGEKFANNRKMEKLQTRLGNLQHAIDIMDTKIAQNMVIELASSSIIGPIKKGGKLQFNNMKKGQKVAVYRIKGDVQVITPEEGKELTLHDHKLKGASLNYGQLNYVGSFTKDSKPEFTEKGWTYLVDNNPKNMIPISGAEAKYNNALFKATYANEINPDIFLTDSPQDFRDGVRVLRAQITSDYIKTVGDALSNRVLSQGRYAINESKEGRAITEFIDEWIGRVDTKYNQAEAMNLILRYIIQPKVIANSYYKDTRTNIDMPVHRTNEHLAKTIIDWAENPELGHAYGSEHFVRDLIKDIEHYASGKETEVDIGGYDRSIADRYDYTQHFNPQMANVIKTLSKHLNFFFASPILTMKRKGVIQQTRSIIQTVKGKDGREIPVRKMFNGKPEEGTYFEFADGVNPKGC